MVRRPMSNRSKPPCSKDRRHYNKPVQPWQTLNARSSVTKLLLKTAQLVVKNWTPEAQLPQQPEKRLALPKRILAQPKPMSGAAWLASNNCKLSWDKRTFALQSAELWRRKTPT